MWSPPFLLVWTSIVQAIIEITPPLPCPGKKYPTHTFNMELLNVNSYLFLVLYPTLVEVTNTANKSHLYVADRILIPIIQQRGDFR